MIIDMWYGDDVKSVDKVTYTFYDGDCEYRGNLYKNGKPIGDYRTQDSTEIEKTFSWLKWECSGNPNYNYRLVKEV